MRVSAQLLYGFICLPLFWSVTTQAAPPKLILQITVDQLRGDLPDKFMKNMGKGGFRYLKAKGIWYANAHFGYSNTETVVGHTTLATGADPAVHGMVSNVWFDQEVGEQVYNVADSQHHILQMPLVDGDEDAEFAIPPVTLPGRSPVNLPVSTFSDELFLATDGKSKIFSVSVKDRGAIPLAGHAGKAFWFAKQWGQFVTSSWYYDTYPEWAAAWNQQNKTAYFDDSAWVLLHDQSTYRYGDKDDQPWEQDVAGYGRTFPHKFGVAGTKKFNTRLTFSPVGDTLTLDFAKTLIAAEQLGADEITDFLAISFSSTDYVGHIFGPSSLEAEDNLLRLDRTLANLFEFVDRYVGLENTLIVLSADHGAPETPGKLQSLGIDAGGVSPEHWDQEAALAVLKKRFGVGRELFQPFHPPYLYLNRKVISEHGLNQADVEQAVAAELMKIPGVATVISRTAMQNNSLPDSYLNRAALRNFYSERSGDLLVLLKPHYFLNNFHGIVMAANHGSPWDYDTYVPIIFAGNGLQAQRIHKRVDPVAVATTLSAWMGIKAPSGSAGKILNAVLERH